MYFILLLVWMKEKKVQILKIVKKIQAGHLAHTVILATQEAERNQEDGSSKPAWADSSQDPISKKPNTKKGLLESLKW
jgi:hypothetical protein